MRRVVMGVAIALFLVGAVVVLAGQLGVFRGYFGGRATTCIAGSDINQGCQTNGCATGTKRVCYCNSAGTGYDSCRCIVDSSCSGNETGKPGGSSSSSSSSGGERPGGSSSSSSGGDTIKGGGSSSSSSSSGGGERGRGGSSSSSSSGGWWKRR